METHKFSIWNLAQTKTIMMRMIIIKNKDFMKWYNLNKERIILGGISEKFDFIFDVQIKNN